MSTKIVSNMIELTGMQVEALAVLSQNWFGKMVLEQTYTLSGGTHLYVTLGSDIYHVSGRGVLQKMGPAEE